jgi:uncharacterized membrane protein
MRNLQPIVIGVLFVAAGTLHFVRPRMYESIMPPFITAPHAIVLISGGLEILGGIGVMLPATRVAAGWGLIALLIAVFPANIYMATDTKFEKLAPRWALFARLPLQFVLIWWIYATCVRART